MDTDQLILGGFAVGVAFLASFLVSRLSSVFQFGSDCHLEEKPQRMHQHQVSRLGGVGIIVGLGTYILLGLPETSVFTLEVSPLWVILVGLPVFIFGLAEDCWGNISPRVRLLAAIGSALVAGVILKAVLPIPGISTGGWVVICWVFTCFCVAGVTHAFNIIDGLNGLSSGVAVIILFGLGWVAYLLGDEAIMQLSLGVIAATSGFLLVNYPKGRIFLGDGGAYLLGFLIAEISILLLVRHSQLSWFFPLALAIYPVTETLYSIYRRKIKSTGAQKADALHLHSLVHKRMNRWSWGSRSNDMGRNAISTTFFWVWQGLSTLVVLMIWDQKLLLMCYCAASIALYLSLYWMVVYFKVPKWMRIISRPQVEQQELNFSDLAQESYNKEESHLEGKGQPEPVLDKNNPIQETGKKSYVQQFLLDDKN